ncbi:unnamed protein product [Effrenium voratum]|nr:unnamed protein product [Effrenium voratum]
MGLKCCAIDRVSLSSHAGIFLLVFTVDGPASSSHALQFHVAEALNRTTALYQTFACAVEHCRMTALLGQPLENLRADASIPFAAVVSNTCSALVASNEIDNSVSVWQTFCGKSNLATSSANATPTAGNTAYLRCGDALKVHWRDAKKLEDVTTLGCKRLPSLALEIEQENRPVKLLSPGASSSYVLAANAPRDCLLTK